MIAGQLSFDLDGRLGPRAHSKDQLIAKIRASVTESGMSDAEAEAVVEDAIEAVSGRAHSEAVKPKLCICDHPVIFAAELGSGICGLWGREPRS